MLNRINSILYKDMKSINILYILRRDRVGINMNFRVIIKIIID